MEENTEQRVAVITGVTKGYGRAVAEHLVHNGWRVIGDGRTEPGSPLSDIDFIRGDIREIGHRSQLLDLVVKAGGLDLLVNNASSLGPTPLPPLLELDVAEMASLFEVNLATPIALIQLLVPVCRAGAVVVNLSSDAAVEPYPGWGAYGSSKSALDHVTRVLNVEHPSIRWYSLDPGDMQTDMHQAAFPGEDISDRPMPEVSAPAILRLYEDALPPGRYAAPELLKLDGEGL